MTAHTPGPWKWFDYPDGRKLLASTERAVIHCPDAPMACDPPDAQLIAAAPDLLAALLSVVDNFGPWHDDDCPADDTCDCSAKPIHDAVNAAVAKAEGR